VNASDIAVIRARLPYVDRRALSQAWFSALHQEEDVRAQVASRRKDAVAESGPGTTAAAAPRTPRAERETTQTALPQRRTAASRRAAAAPEARSALAPRAAHRAHEAPSAVRRNWHGASFTVNVGEARVRILARSSGNRLTLVAVCSARYAQLVARALAHASAGLREAGAFVNATVHCREES
jgi:hypothetical protein